MSTKVGEIYLVAKIDTSQYKKGANDIEKANSDMEGSASRTSARSNTFFNGIAKAGLAAVAAAAVAAGAAIITNIGNAVSRVDTLNNFPRVMANLGYGAAESTKAIKALDKGVQGLPTSLDEISAAMQNIAPSARSLGEATKLTLALNNALLAGGKSTAVQSTAMEQFSQAISKGKPDMMEWRTLVTAMPGQLDQIGQSLGYGRGEWQKMAQDVSDGVRPFSDITDAIMKLNEDGLGQMPSFAQQAKNATTGLETGWKQFNTAVTRGLAAIIQAVGSENISSAFGRLGKTFEDALKAVIPFINFIKQNSQVIGPLAAGITAMVAAITAWYTITKLMTIAQAIFNAVLTANPIGLVIVAIVGLVAALVWFFTQTKLGQSLFQGFMNVVKSVFSWIAANWPLLLTLLLGPFGIFITTVIKNFDTIRSVAIAVFGAIKNVVLGVINWLRSNWQLVLGIMLGPFGVAVGLIIRHFNTIRSAVGSVYNWIRSTFSNIGALGAGIVRGAVNAVLGFASRTINNFINMVNGVLGAINRLPGVNIGRIGAVSIPQLAKGGIVTAPTLAMVGEGNEEEAVIPLSKLDQMLSNGGNQSSGNSNVTVNLNMQGVMTRSKQDEREIAKSLVARINEELSAKGQPLLGGGAI